MPENKIFAIHQPNFFPWLGYFNKIKTVTDFVFFDVVQRPQGKSWLQRVKVLCNGKPGWLTIPINKSGTSIQPINEATISGATAAVEKLLNTIKSYYAGHPCFDEVFDFLKKNKPAAISLSEFNRHYIQKISQRLGLQTNFHLASERPALINTGLTGNTMILAVCKEFGIKSYLSGNGCLDFFQPGILEEEGTKVSFQQFNQVSYPQQFTNTFEPGLSVLDALFNIGFEKTKEII